MKKFVFEVDRFEDVVDRIKEEIRDFFSLKFMMVVVREDVFIYFYMQDKVVDVVEDIVKWFFVKEFGNILEEIKEVIFQMGMESIKVVKFVYEVIVQMDRVIESGFVEKEIEREYEIIYEIEGVESKIDGFDMEFMRLVFQNVGRMDWSEGFYIFNIVRIFSNIFDKVKDVVERIRLMMNK